MVRRPRTMPARGPRRAVVAIAVAAVLVTLGATPVQAATPAVHMLRYLNNSRTNHDLKPVKINVRLSDDAKAHTRRMIRRDQLVDVTNLTQVLSPYDWTVGGAVVGCGRTLFAIHRAFMRDKVHHDIILTRKYRRVGIGIVRVDGKSSCGKNAFWVTEIFYG